MLSDTISKLWLTPIEKVLDTYEKEESKCDYLICKVDENVKINFDDFWVVNGKVFEKTMMLLILNNKVNPF